MNSWRYKVIEKQRNDLTHYIEQIKDNTRKILSSLSVELYLQTIQLILDSEAQGGRVHITGIGKPAHIGGYIASLMSSTGTPTYELHGTEAVHGSSGQVRPGDVVIAISNSGETRELKSTIIALKNNGAKIIGVTGNAESWLAMQSDCCLLASASMEGGPLNRAPRASIIAEIIVLQGLSVLLQSIKGITPQQYVKWHPGGALGKPKR